MIEGGKTPAHPNGGMGLGLQNGRYELYPNSVNRRAAGTARPSGRPSSPVPRRAPAPYPRRPPGRPKPQAPRRPATPNWRPVPKIQPPRVVPPRPIVPRIPAVSPGVILAAARFIPYVGAFALGFAVAYWFFSRPMRTVTDPMGELEPHGWEEWGWGVDAGYSLPWTFQGVQKNLNIRPPVSNTQPKPVRVDANGRLTWPSPIIPPGIDHISYWSIWHGGGVARYGYHLRSLKRPVGNTDAPPEWLPQGTQIAGPLQAIQPAPTPLPWVFGYVPELMPILPGPNYIPEAPPIGRPVPRPVPETPQMPDVGPRPAPAPAPAPAPGSVPRPPELPELIPELVFPPVAPPYGRAILSPRGMVRQQPRAQHKYARAPKGTKEMKARVGRVVGFIWGALGQVTEYIDTVDVIYEALPKRFKREKYKELGRQPTPFEKAILIYENFDDLDIEKAVNGYIKQQISDALYALGSDRIAEANRQNNRPIGYEAGGSLTGGGERVDLPNTAPDWWPDFLPWRP